MSVPVDLVEFLKFLATPAVGAVVTSFLLSKWPKFQEYDVFWKRFWSVLVSFAVGIVFYALNVYLPNDFVKNAAPFFTAGITVTLLVLGTQSVKALGFTDNKPQG